MKRNYWLALSVAGLAACAGGDESADTDMLAEDSLAIDETAAGAIIAARPIEDMREVDALLAADLSDAGRDSIYARVWKPLDLNSASAEEIMLIPGVGERMQHEFEEYRPYTSIDQFRREIGKYVDDAEVARLEQYVTIR